MKRMYLGEEVDKMLEIDVASEKLKVEKTQSMTTENRNHGIFN